MSNMDNGSAIDKAWSESVSETSNLLDHAVIEGVLSPSEPRATTRKRVIKNGSDEHSIRLIVVLRPGERAETVTEGDRFVSARIVREEE